jgi:dCMP deaminase
MKKGSEKSTLRVKHIRPSWDEYFMNIAELVGSRGTCDRGRAGCVIVRDRRILVTGYVGSAAGHDHCDDVGHEMAKVIGDDGITSEHCIRTIHAEQNAIAQAAQMGIAINGGTLYCHFSPCYVCAKMLINAGIKRIVANLDYHRAQKSKLAFKKSGVKFELLNKQVHKYPRQ